jgi:hypothetical protein
MMFAAEPEGDVMAREFWYPLQRVVGLLLTIGGIWHSAAPWVFGYSAIRAAVISNMSAGIALAVVGICFIIFRGGWVLNCLAATIGIWVLVAPQILGIPKDELADLEAIWGGPLAIALAAIAAYDLHFNRADNTGESRSAPA